MLALISNYTNELEQARPVPKLVPLKRKRKKAVKKRIFEDDTIYSRQGLPIDETESSLCELMWQSTIVQALYDLAAGEHNKEAKLIRAEAANWFAQGRSAKNGDSDFDIVCELACLHKCKVLKMAGKVMKEGEKALEGFNFRTIRRDLSEHKQRRAR